jgi:hypothetical protein
MSTGGDGSGGSTALSGSSALSWRQYTFCDFVENRIQHKTPSFFRKKPHLKAMGMFSAKAGQDTSCAHASSHRGRGL